MISSKARTPLNTFAIPLGLTGLAELWSDAGAAFRLPAVALEPLWAAAALATVVTISAHVVRGLQSSDRFISQLRHPAQGPIAAMLPIIGMLIGINLFGFWPLGGTILIVGSMVIATAFAGWLVSFWLRGELILESVHGGYFLPTVASSFVAGGAASTLGWAAFATAAFAVGAFFWLVMFALVGARLSFLPALPAPLIPTMAVLMAPPAVGGLAWFAYDGGRLDVVEQGLLGLAVVLLLVQVGLLPRYRRVPFTLGYWSFAFPSAFVGAYLIVWMSKSPFAGWQIVAAVILAAVTALILAIAVLSVRLYLHGRRPTSSELQPDAVITAADNSIELASLRG